VNTTFNLEPEDGEEYLPRGGYSNDWYRHKELVMSEIKRAATERKELRSDVFKTFSAHQKEMNEKFTQIEASTQQAVESAKTDILAQLSIDREHANAGFADIKSQVRANSEFRSETLGKRTVTAALWGMVGALIVSLVIWVITESDIPAGLMESEPQRTEEVVQ